MQAVSGMWCQGWGCSCSGFGYGCSSPSRYLYFKTLLGSLITDHFCHPLLRMTTHDHTNTLSLQDNVLVWSCLQAPVRRRFRQVETSRLDSFKDAPYCGVGAR
ncbi:hypothetical protein TNCV_1510871 [Trichonephila clavipes]|nr:hypothetical protein TNCV_1510871 [Trichonephila clavipes]